MSNYYFTFGSNHVNVDGVSLGNNYVVINKRLVDSARMLMLETRGGEWSLMYTEQCFKRVAEKCNLTQINLVDVYLPNNMRKRQ